MTDDAVRRHAEKHLPAHLARAAESKTAAGAMQTREQLDRRPASRRPTSTPVSTTASSEIEGPATVRPLTNARHERFCQEYLMDLNAAAAYRRTYPDAKRTTADANGIRLLGNARVVARIAELKAARSARTEVSADRVVQELASIGFSDMRHFSSWGPTGVVLLDSASLTEMQARCVAEVSETRGEKSSSLRFKLHDKVGALVKLGQHLGIFVEKHEVTGSGGGPIEVHQLSPVQKVEALKAILALGRERMRLRKAGSCTSGAPVTDGS